MNAHRALCRGFTLIELMITLAIGVILMTLAVPSMVNFRRSSELNAATNTLLVSLNTARSEAMKRGINAMAVPSANGTNWATGWEVFVDVNRNQVYSGADVDISIQSQAALPSYFTIEGNNNATGTTPYVMFNASGFAQTKGTGGSATGGPGNLAFRITRTDIVGSSYSEATRLIIIAPTGRVRSCKPANATDANCLFSAAAGNS